MYSAGAGVLYRYMYSIGRGVLYRYRCTLPVLVYSTGAGVLYQYWCKLLVQVYSTSTCVHYWCWCTRLVCEIFHINTHCQTKGTKLKAKRYVLKLLFKVLMKERRKVTRSSKYAYVLNSGRSTQYYACIAT